MSEETKTEVVTAFTVIMTMDGLVGVEIDQPDKQMIRTATLTDIQMMSTFVRDSIVHPKPTVAQPAPDVASRVSDALAARSADEGE